MPFQSSYDQPAIPTRIMEGILAEVAQPPGMTYTACHSSEETDGKNQRADAAGNVGGGIRPGISPDLPEVRQGGPFTLRGAIAPLQSELHLDPSPARARHHLSGVPGYPVGGAGRQHLALARAPSDSKLPSLAEVFP